MTRDNNAVSSEGDRVTFHEATDKLLAAGVQLADVAGALGLAHASVRRFRLDPASSAYRSPPAGWEARLARLARERSKQLDAIAGRLERLQ